VDQHEKAAKAIVREYKSIPSVKSVMVYGSYARGEYSKNSDIDLTVLLDSEKFCHSDASKLVQHVSRVQRRFGVRLEPVASYERSLK
jgi:predicted nucleotidyltransferase